MKKAFMLIISIFVFSLVNGQNLYSYENLKKATTEELNDYLIKAQKQKRVGTAMSIAGPVSTATGLLMWTSAWSGGTESSLHMGGILILGGAITTIIGVPLLISGSSRVKKINEIISTSSYIKFDLMPDAQYNLITQNYQPAVTLRIRF